MKKIIHGFLYCFCLTVTGACYFSLASEDSANHNAKHLAVETLGSNQNKEKQPISRKTDAKYPLVLLGSIDLREGKVEITENQVWTDGRDGKDIQDAEEDDFLQVESGEEIEVDVINCAGFIAKGKANQSSDNYGWKLKIVPQSLSTGASEKVRQCASPIYSADEKNVTGNVFAIAPAKNNRQSIKMAKVDPKKLFVSLPKATQVWADGSKKELGRKKGTLAIEKDNWADTDGDGRIDLVLVFGSCENREYSCGSLLLLIDDKWKEIAYITPA